MSTATGLLINVVLRVSCQLAGSLTVIRQTVLALFLLQSGWQFGIWKAGQFFKKAEIYIFTVIDSALHTK